MQFLQSGNTAKTYGFLFLGISGVAPWLGSGMAFRTDPIAPFVLMMVLFIYVLTTLLRVGMNLQLYLKRIVTSWFLCQDMPIHY